MDWTVLQSRPGLPLAAAALAGALLLCAAYVFVLADDVRALREARAESAALRATEESLRAESAAIAAFPEHLARLRALAPEFAAGAAQRLAQLDALADAHGLALSEFHPEAARREGGVVLTPLRVTLTGGYRALAAFTAEFTALPGGMALGDVQISRGDTAPLVMRAEILATSFASADGDGDGGAAKNSFAPPSPPPAAPWFGEQQVDAARSNPFAILGAAKVATPSPSLSPSPTPRLLGVVSFGKISRAIVKTVDGKTVSLTTGERADGLLVTAINQNSVHFIDRDGRKSRIHLHVKGGDHDK